MTEDVHAETSVEEWSEEEDESAFWQQPPLVTLTLSCPPLGRA